MVSSSLTDHLLSLYQSHLQSATTHPFLTQAGAGTLSQSTLCKWLVQDKYYQFAYVNFIGGLISKLNLASYAFPAKGEENLEWKTLNTLITAMEGIKSEIDFYNDTAEKYDLPLEQEGENEITRKYRQLFEESCAPGKPIIWGLTVLWATEFCYLKAWSYAEEQKGGSMPTQESKGAIAALHKEFIPNWTSDDFKAAVDTLADVTNAWAAGPEKGEESNCEKLWLYVLELETSFWPTVPELQVS